MRSRLVPSDFRKTCYKRIQDWSTERAEGCVNLKEFATKPTYTLQLQTEALSFTAYLSWTNALLYSKSIYSILFAIRLKIFIVCQQDKNIPIGQKRKRERPALAKKALLKQ